MGCDLAPLHYLRRWKSLNQMTSNSGAPDYGASGGGTIKSVSMFTNLMAQSSKFVMEGVKNLGVKRHKLPVTKIVEELMEVSITSKVSQSKLFGRTINLFKIYPVWQILR